MIPWEKFMMGKDEIKNHLMDSMILGGTVRLYCFDESENIAAFTTHTTGKYMCFPIIYAGRLELITRSAIERVSRPVDHTYAIWFLEKFYNEFYM